MQEDKIHFSLSKSTFIRGKQCVKSLYLNKHFRELKDPLSEDKKAVFQRGTDVGVLAQSLFPGGLDATPEKAFDYASSLKKTKDAIDAGIPVIYEAAFLYNGVLAMLDILVLKEGKCYAYEVKSSFKISDTYISDAALQYYVICGSGLELADFSMINLNSSYVRQGALHIPDLFSITSVLNKVQAKQDDIEASVNRFKQILTQESVPDIFVGTHCASPYECDFMGHCWKNIESDSVFELSASKADDMALLYQSGVRRLKDIPDDYPLNTMQRIQVNCEKNGQEHIDKPRLTDFFKKLQYPLYFFDIESFMPAVPIYEGNRPFMHIPFLFSLHSLSSSDAELQHTAFIAFPGADPRKEFAEKLLEVVGQEGSILVYNTQFERGICHALATEFPEYAERMQAITSRMLDLMEVFKSGTVYYRSMYASCSLKSVLPALCPGDDYSHLDVSNGNAASRIYEGLQHVSQLSIFETQETLSQLTAYCTHDTMAMVKIYKKLCELSYA